MKLIAEQVKYLRERKKELEGKKEEYRKYCQTRESGGLDGFGAPHFLDYQEQLSNSRDNKELRDIEYALGHADYVMNRNFEMIDIGTGFTVNFGDGEKDRTVLIEEGTTSAGHSMFASTASDFGKAVIGKKAGDKVEYTVSATGRKISATIESIDNIRSHYTNFIREKDFSQRVSRDVKRRLKYDKAANLYTYWKGFAMTPSQKELLEAELRRLDHTVLSQSELKRKSNIERLLRENNMAPLPVGDRIQPGSHVQLFLKDGEEITEMNFEFINKAVSTEIEGEYVEKYSPLGQAIVGLRPGQSFELRRNHQPALEGMISSVDNDYALERVR